VSPSLDLHLVPALTLTGPIWQLRAGRLHQPIRSDGRVGHPRDSGADQHCTALF
jgi:hypothetical protein